MKQIITYAGHKTHREETEKSTRGQAETSKPKPILATMKGGKKEMPRNDINLTQGFTCSHDSLILSLDLCVANTVCTFWRSLRYHSVQPFVEVGVSWFLCMSRCLLIGGEMCWWWLQRGWTEKSTKKEWQNSNVLIMRFWRPKLIKYTKLTWRA